MLLMPILGKQVNNHSPSSAPVAVAQTVFKMQLLGINCLRVPFSFQTLWRVAPGSKAASCNPASQAEVRASVIPPGAKVPSSAKVPGLVCPVLDTSLHSSCRPQTLYPVP